MLPEPAAGTPTVDAIDSPWPKADAIVTRFGVADKILEPLALELLQTLMREEREAARLKALLVRYIAHVTAWEGVDFIDAMPEGDDRTALEALAQGRVDQQEAIK